jgi:hypothetical protein
VPVLPAWPPPLAEITPLTLNSADEKNEVLPMQKTEEVPSMKKETPARKVPESVFQTEEEDTVIALEEETDTAAFQLTVLETTESSFVNVHAKLLGEFRVEEAK